ncbi:branched-chain amino acid ABC transporter permease [Clostridiaceae bacterium NSJ-31]|uniref:Branched-chain amino acid ABC transporter permease n=1 Tax=Ligaoa zhengdingensis TaxID=2763658 RepID=A0A926I460_9FIRM|nr:branched-chain amino acid ABC transporter permease [Ligaoa zhengdingensis]MBC8547054.1 branched-chain amino acid ABC transporter permease [Ligaoa zhengdingensis]
MKLYVNQKTAYRSYVINLIAVVLVFLLLKGLMSAGIINSYVAGVCMTVMINIILAASLTLTTGLLGQIALGHAGFMSVGAYSAALLVKHAKDSGVVLSTPDGITPAGYGYFLLSLLLAGVVAAFFGLIVGIPALRLKGDYLAIITLGFGEIIRVIIENVKFTGGAQGLSGIPRLASFDVVFWLTALIIAILFAFVRSRHGRAIKAIREDDIASEACGISNTYYKVMAFTMSAFFAGIAGAIYAQQMAVLGAKTFNFLKSIDILVIVVLGGLGSLTGSIVAATGLTILPEALRSFSEYRMVIYSLALIIVMIFKPSGLFGNYEFSLTHLLSKLRRPKSNTPAAGGESKQKEVTKA